MSDNIEAAIDSEGEQYATIQRAETLVAIASALIESGSDVTVHVTGEDARLREVRRNQFKGCLTVAEAIDAGSLELRSADDIHSSVVGGADETTLLTQTGTDFVSLSVSDADSHEELASYAEGQFEQSEEFSLRTPSHTRMMEGFASTFGDDEQEQFEEAFEQVDLDSDNDEVMFALLYAASNGLLLYDMGAWAEDTGVSSKATVSRKKNDLEERGLITTKKVPREVGRPRMRLHLSNGYDGGDTVSIWNEVTA